MRLLPTAAAFGIAAILAAPVQAATVGQPFLVIESATGSLLDNFDGGIPTGILNTTLSGTVTEAFGAPTTVGKPFAFETTLIIPDFEASLTLGTTTLIDAFFAEEVISGVGTSYQYDPLVAGPGDLNFPLLIFPPITEPVIGTFIYGGDFSDWPDRVAPFPEFEVMLSVFLNAPLPTRVNEFTDPFSGEVFRDVYIEGPLDIDRITLGTVGGPPLPPDAVIPLPAAGYLLLGALGGLAASARRRRTRAT